MAIVAIILAALLGYLGGRMDDPGVRRILYEPVHEHLL
jgi:hypothetical protein